MELSVFSFVLAFVFGAAVGSFLNVCIVRLPADESLIRPPSHCPRCNARIGFYDNVPLLSYLVLFGRCRSCKTGISPRYFLVELITAVMSVALLKMLGFGFAFFASFVLVAGLIVIAFIDLEVRIVPDIISLPGILLGLIFAVVNWFAVREFSTALPSPLSSFLGIVLGGGILWGVAWGYQLVTGVEGMGGGDVKLLAMIGAFLGWPSVPVALFFASLAGSLVGIFLMLREGAGGKYAIPFAPFLCTGAIFYLFFGERLVSLYLALY